MLMLNMDKNYRDQWNREEVEEVTWDFTHSLLCVVRLVPQGMWQQWLQVPKHITLIIS